MSAKQLYTTGQIARMIGIAEKTVRNYCERGLLRCHKTPITGYRRISREDLLSFLEEHNLGADCLQQPPARRILIADDNDDFRTALCHILTRAFGDTIELATARDGYETCITAGAFCPELILLDLVMPRTDGLEVARSLRSSPRTRHIDIVVLSGFVELTDRQRLASLGVTTILPKPVGEEEVVGVVKERVWGEGVAVNLRRDKRTAGGRGA